MCSGFVTAVSATPFSATPSPVWDPLSHPLPRMPGSSVGTGLCQPVPRPSRSFPSLPYPPPGLCPPAKPRVPAVPPHAPLLLQPPLLPRARTGRNPPQHPGSSLPGAPQAFPPTPSAQDSPVLSRPPARCLPGPPSPLPPPGAARCRLPQPRPRALPLAEPPPSSFPIGCCSGRVPRSPPLRFLHRLPGSAAPWERERLVEGGDWRTRTSITRRTANEKGGRGMGGRGCHIRAWRAVARRWGRGGAHKGLNSIAFSFWPFPWKI